MPSNKIPVELLSTVTSAPVGSPRVGLLARISARLQPTKYDRMLAVGVPAAPGSALAAHEARLTSTAEREAVARALRDAKAEAGRGVLLSSRVPVHAENVRAAEDLIDAITLRLHSPRPVCARGMARLRLVLSDGRGPLYRFGRGDLSGRLGAAHAAL
jgi:hypothetical protein